MRRASAEDERARSVSARGVGPAIALAAAALTLLVGSSLVRWIRTGGAGARGTSPAARLAAPSPFALCVWHERSAARAGEPAWSPGLASSVILALTTTERAELSRLLDTANARWEARANPFAEDLGEGDPDAPLAAWIAHAPPSVGVALAAASDRACGTDGFCVRAVRSTGAGGCDPPAAPPRFERDLERARFLAWPVGHGVVVRVPSADDAHVRLRSSIVTALRTAARTSGCIGLVLSAEDADVARDEAHAPLRSRLLRHEALRRAEWQAPDRAADAPAPRAASAAGIEAPSDEIVILARLGTIGAPGALEAEVRALVPAGVEVGPAVAPIE